MLAQLITARYNVWIVDEFCANLDPVTANVVADRLQRIARSLTATVIVATPHCEPFIRSLRPDKVIRIVLPDHSLRRPPLLFATGLIMYALKCMEKNRPGGQVVYFGSTIGIRSYLSKTKVGNLVLDSVFPYEYTLARGRSRTKLKYPKQPLTKQMAAIRCAKHRGVVTANANSG